VSEHNHYVENDVSEIIMFKVMYVMRLISLNADYTTAVLCMQFHSFPDYCSRGISSQLSAKPLHHKVITIHLQIL